MRSHISLSLAIVAAASMLGHVADYPQSADNSGTRCTHLVGMKGVKKPADDTRCPRIYTVSKKQVVPNRAPSVNIKAEGALSFPEVLKVGPTAHIQALGVASDPDNDSLLYSWSTNVGRVTGEGAQVKWDLTSAPAGTYTLLLEVDDGCGCVAYTSQSVALKP